MRKLIVLLCVMMSCMMTFADVKLPVNCEAALPKLLATNLIKQSDVSKVMSSGNYGQSDTRKTYWIAYSDRENNTTYQSPGGSAYGKLEFNEPVRIAKISGDYALVYSEPAKGMVYPKISERATSRGWVSMKHLLLWNSCPTNEQMIYNKALIVMNLDQRQNMDGQALCYKNPAQKDRGTRLRTNMEFYFVMKEEGNLSLLARQYKIGGTMTDQVLYGWVNKAYYIPWDQRSCLEPNWNKEVADYFAANNSKATVYENKDLTNPKSIMPLGRENSVPGRNDANKYRLNPTAMRFPILDNKTGNSNLYHCTAFAGSGGGTTEVPVGGGGEETVFIDNTLKEKSIINLIVVIDGTSSMENFYKPMQEAIQQANTFFGTQNRTVRVGVVIYRDYLDGQYLTEVQPMVSPNDPGLAAFLSNGGKYGIKSHPDDKTWAEALYKGLEVALDAGKMGYSPNNSNIMFVVGDCGNDLDDKKCLSEPAIVSKMAANHIQLASFQVRYQNEHAFLLFRKQMNDIVRANMEKQYSELDKGERGIKGGFKEIPHGYEFKLQRETNFFMGSSHFAEQGKEMMAANLYELVKSRYEQFGTVIDLWMKTINEGDVTLSGASENVGYMERKFLESIFTKEQIERIKKNSSLMACSGYTEKKDASGREYWKPVLYMSSDEFAALREKLKPVSDAAKRGGTDRRPYVNAIKALIRAQLPDLSEAELNNMSVEEIMTVIGGLNLSIGATNGRTLLQIQNETIVNQAEFDGMVQAFNKKYNKLERMAEQNYPFKVERNNSTYYWLPAEDLP